MVKYGLVGNDWLQNLYNRREKWVPAYLWTMFCAGMSTTQKSESMNKFFKDYIRSSTMVSDFVHQYEKTLDARYFKEKEKYVRTKSTKAVLKTCWTIKEEATKVYIRKSFEIFQDVLFNSQQYKVTKVQKEGESKMYEVAPDGKHKRVYYVNLESGEAKAICTCHMFEFLELGSQSSFRMNHLSLTLEKVHKKLLLMEDVGDKNLEVGEMSRNDSCMLRSHVISNFSQTVQDPQRVPTKGRPKSLRAKNPEKTQAVKKMHCSICKIEGHTKNNCPSLGNLGNINEELDSQMVDLEEHDFNMESDGAVEFLGSMYLDLFI
ncbi:protein FAR1-RELATED SEQUENCE 5-like [Carya illinoinensis]|uniref:protein FAR1-RELATED SEQUENCE 5-like n=1 Tax=Carya illinoinensis TaxID=32201 RepID=UPI001C729351|nr:protein FAR1-RELATED SEQUENCE 5-like [Carya illinoinensis]